MHFFNFEIAQIVLCLSGCTWVEEYGLGNICYECYNDLASERGFWEF